MMKRFLPSSLALVCISCGGEAGELGVLPLDSGDPGFVTTGGSSLGTGGTGSVTSLPGSGGSLIGSGGGGTGGALELPSCGEPWQEGASYVVGDIVSKDGLYFRATNDNPGYDPVISTWFWETYSCTTSGGTGGSGGGSSGSGLSAILSKAQFEAFFPTRNAFYTYEGLIAAAGKFPAFATTGDADTQKREVAAFLANVARETGLLVYIEQIAKDTYCQSSAACPCAAGKQYYGRGPIQISWNYNYCTAGVALGYDLRAQPELVAQNAEIAWATGLWFWMTEEGAGYYPPHNGITEGHGFGETIRSINGGQECGGAWPEAVNSRVGYYTQFCNALGVTPGSNLSC